MIPKSEKKKKMDKKPSTGKIEYYYALRRVPRETDHWPAFQVEVVGIDGDQLVKKQLLGKPDTLTMVMATLTELTDPRNATEHTNETISL